MHTPQLVRTEAFKLLCFVRAVACNALQRRVGLHQEEMQFVCSCWNRTYDDAGYRNIHSFAVRYSVVEDDTQEVVVAVDMYSSLPCCVLR